ncbi:MAG: saccharopine dehydrogenase NADP-binding domain-containing protein [Hyphomonadaceae bacterium]|nr:saccharopine dehydrogenase NADP-binding domain-containing protein [Hyphomonadaceae bacterium]
MKIAVTGASGIQGMSSMIYLLDQEDVTEVFVSDPYNTDRLAARVDALGDARLTLSDLDCTDEEAAAKAFEGYDVVLNCAMSPGKYIDTTRAALRAGANYLDMTSFGQEPMQFALHDEFEKIGKTAVLDMGTAPGLSNVMAVYCMEQLDQVDEIDFAWGVIDLTPPSEQSRPLNWGYGFEGIMGLMSGPSITCQNGEIVEEEPRARPEKFKYKIGEYTMRGMPHREPRMLLESFPEKGFKHIMYRQAFNDEYEEKYAFLRDLGFNSRDPIDVKGVKVAPFDVLWTLLQNLPEEQKAPSNFVSEGNCIARGIKDGRKLEVRLMVRVDPEGEMHKRYTSKGASGSYRTGISASITACMLGRGEITKKGVYRPEICVPAEPYIRAQAEAGMEVEETIGRLL